jgi:hypothetical protein
MVRVAAISAACLMLAVPALASTAEPAGALQARPQKAWLRGVDPNTTGSVEPSPVASARPPCPPDRKVGTGAGFCVIN